MEVNAIGVVCLRETNEILGSTVVMFDGALEIFSIESDVITGVPVGEEKAMELLILELVERNGVAIVD